MLALPAQAQPRRGGETDSTETPPIAVFQALQPSYTTNYDVQRQVTNWVQILKITSQFGTAKFTNETNFLLNEDSGREEQRRTGTNKTTLSWVPIRRVPVGLNLSLGRITSEQTNNGQANGDANLGFNASTTRRILAWTNKFGVRSGFLRRTQTSVLGDAETKNFNTGFNLNLDWQGNWTGGPFGLEMQFKDDRTSKKSRTETADVTQEQPTSGHGNTFRTRVDLKPSNWVSTDIEYSNIDGQDESYNARGGVNQGLETTIRQNNSVIAHLDLTPGTNTNWTFEYEVSDHALLYAINTGNGSAGDENRFRSNLKTQGLGFDWDGTLSIRNSTVAPQSSANHDDKDNQFELKAIRQLNNKFGLNIAGWVRATRYFYTSGSEGERQDRDERKTRFSPSLTYKASEKFSSTLTYTQLNTRWVGLNPGDGVLPGNAAQTRNEEDYTVDFAFSFRFGAFTSLNQTYSIKANYRTFDYREENNRLTSTQRITTGLSSQLAPRVSLRVDHRFTLIDDGPYSVDEDGGRLFARSKRTWTQELTTALNYTVYTWLTLNADSLLRRRDILAEATDIQTTVRTYEMSLGGSLQRQLGRGLNVNLTTNYVQGNARDPYWLVTSGLTKVF